MATHAGRGLRHPGRHQPADREDPVDPHRAREPRQRQTERDRRAPERRAWLARRCQIAAGAFRQLRAVAAGPAAGGQRATGVVDRIRTHRELLGESRPGLHRDAEPRLRDLGGNLPGRHRRSFPSAPAAAVPALEAQGGRAGDPHGRPLPPDFHRATRLDAVRRSDLRRGTRRGANRLHRHRLDRYRVRAGRLPRQTTACRGGGVPCAQRRRGSDQRVPRDRRAAATRLSAPRHWCHRSRAAGPTTAHPERHACLARAASDPRQRHVDGRCVAGAEQRRQRRGVRLSVAGPGQRRPRQHRRAAGAVRGAHVGLRDHRRRVEPGRAEQRKVHCESPVPSESSPAQAPRAARYVPVGLGDDPSVRHR